MGNMIGAYQGIEYQEKYINGLQKKEEIIADVNKFIDVLFDQ
jgi:hypothetical protein